MTTPRGVATVLRQQSEPTRGALRDLRRDLVDDDRPRREYYPLSPSSKPANVVVKMTLGQGNDPAELAKALKAFKSQMTKSGTFREIKRRGFYVKPGERARLKSRMARRRAAKAALKRARRNAWEEARGL